MRSRFTEPHHVRHWTAQGGTTDLANLVALCFKHHDDVHVRGWQVVRVDGQREVLVIPPEPLRDVPIRGPGPPSAAGRDEESRPAGRRAAHGGVGSARG